MDEYRDAWLHDLVYTSPMAIAMLLGPDLKIKIANQRMHDIWGKAYSVVGERFFDAMPELVEQGYDKIIQTVYEKGNPVMGVEETIVLYKDGIIRLGYFDLTFYPQRSKNGSINGIGIIASDVTERALLNNRLKESEEKYRTLANDLEQKVHKRTMELTAYNQKLNEANKELESFTYISSHDLQEPLRKIQMFTSIILLEPKNGLIPKSQEYVGKIKSAANRMQLLINDLLAYSRSNFGERYFEQTSLNDIVRDVIDTMEDEIKQRQATIEYDNLCTIRSIPYQVNQLLQNLLSNALKFAKPDIPPCIQITTCHTIGAHISIYGMQSEKEYCHLCIADNGIGFDPQYNEKIFELFQRLHSKETVIGTGIGLAIAKRIVSNHNGFITATGRPGIGATFDIYIPLDIKMGEQ